MEDAVCGRDSCSDISSAQTGAHFEGSVRTLRRVRMSHFGRDMHSGRLLNTDCSEGSSEVCCFPSWLLRLVEQL